MLCQNIQKLIDGNKRFIEGKALYPNQCQHTMLKTSKKQTPFALILGCSDSRVPIEIIFDAGIGDLFVIRTAGHFLSKSGIASIQYAVEVLGVELIVVLGHTNCGAVRAAIDDQDHHFSPSIERMIETIQIGVNKARKIAKTDEELMDLSVNYNTMESVDFISTFIPEFQDRIKEKKLIIVGARYDLESGLVKFFDDTCNCGCREKVNYNKK